MEIEKDSLWIGQCIGQRFNSTTVYMSLSFFLQEEIILQSMMHLELEKERVQIFNMWDFILNRQQKVSSFAKYII